MGALCICRAPQDDKTALEAYFAEHCIQEKLNTMLNEMVQVRPHAPYGWLAKRIRRDTYGHSPAVGTLPVLPPASKSEFCSGLEKTWGFVLGLQARGGSGASAAPAAGAAGGARARPPTASTGVQLSIEPSTKGVLLCIREA